MNLNNLALLNQAQLDQLKQLVSASQLALNKADFNDALLSSQQLITKSLELIWDQELPSNLFAGLAYSTNGGKRLRGFLVLSCCKLVGGDIQDGIFAGLALEMLHSYSLVHDDHPDMDNDPMRRNQPSTHIKFDNATAILVGDGLQAQAYEILTYSQLSSAQQIQQIKELTRAAGSKGMVLGQAIDIKSHLSPLSLEQLQQLHSLKTGALLQAAINLGALTATPSKGMLELLDQLGNYLGISYQVRDDLLDVLQDQEQLGKTPAKDIQANKSTFVTIIGIEQSLIFLEQCLTSAQQIIAQIATYQVDQQALTWLEGLVQKLTIKKQQ